MIQRHKWSILSLAITIGMGATIGSYTTVPISYSPHHKLQRCAHHPRRSLGVCVCRNWRNSG